MKEKYAFFDFCETLVDLQTADDYIYHIISKREGRWSYKLFVIKFLRNRWVDKILKKLIRGYESPKKIILKMVKGYEEAYFNRVAVEYNEFLKNNYLIDDIVSEMIDLKRKKYKVVIVSGGYGIYIRLFFSSVVDKVIATEIDFVNSKCTGRFSGVDCLGGNKLEKLYKYIDNEKIDYDNSYVFSDSKTDLPLFSLAKNKIVVSKNNSKRWVGEQNEKFIEKIWFVEKVH